MPRPKPMMGLSGLGPSRFGPREREKVTCELGAVEGTGGGREREDSANMQMAFSIFLLPPPSPPPPSPAAAAASTSSSSYLVAAHRGRRPREPRCRCGRSPEITPATTSSSGSGDRGSCEEEESSAPPCLPVELDGAAASADSLTGEPRSLTDDRSYL